MQVFSHLDIRNHAIFYRACKDSVEEDDKRPQRDNLKERTKICAYSSLQLSTDVAFCKLGNLYNKEALVNGLLSKEVHRIFPHIRGLKDVKDLKYSMNSTGTGMMCPITQTDFTGLHRFVAIWSTG